MNRTIRSVSLGDGAMRHTVRLEDRPIHPNEDIHKRKIEFLLEVVTDGPFTGVLSCGPLPFDTMRVFLDGGHWIVILEAEESK